MIKATEYSRKLRRNQTEAERIMWQYLRNRQFLGIKFRRQQIIGEYIVDFVSFKAKVIIELDGEQHRIGSRVDRDNERTMWLTSKGFLVLRFWNEDVLKDTEGVLEQIRILVSR
jgi:very-short-patch-repair endonuclease